MIIFFAILLLIFIISALFYSIGDNKFIEIDNSIVKGQTLLNGYVHKILSIFLKKKSPPVKDDIETPLRWTNHDNNGAANSGNRRVG